MNQRNYERATRQDPDAWKQAIEQVSNTPYIEEQSFPELPTTHQELESVLWRWWELHQRQLQLIEETRKMRQANIEANAQILEEIQGMHTAKWMLVWGLSADARELLSSYRRVSLPGVQFEFRPDQDGAMTDKPMDQLSAFSALDLWSGLSRT